MNGPALRGAASETPDDETRRRRDIRGFGHLQIVSLIVRRRKGGGGRSIDPRGCTRSNVCGGCVRFLRDRSDVDGTQPLEATANRLIRAEASFLSRR